MFAAPIVCFLVEDDMAIDVNVKVPLLKTFHEKLDLKKGWKIDGKL